MKSRTISNMNSFRAMRNKWRIMEKQLVKNKKSKKLGIYGGKKINN